MATASNGRRALGFAIDVLALSVVEAVLVALVPSSTPVRVVVFLVAIVGLDAASAASARRPGSSLGKVALGMSVATADGNRVSRSTAFVRSLLRWPTAIIVCALVGGIKMLHDKWAGTTVERQRLPHSTERYSNS